jgi:iron complex transport system ATP-binding protein
VSAIALEGVSVELGGARVVRSVSAALATGEWAALIGPNGAGKTTLLRAIAGLVRFTGSIAVGGDRVGALGRRSLARRLALVPQIPLTPPELTVAEYVLLGRTPHISYLGAESRRDRLAAERALARLDLLPFADRHLGSLSGGERQRAVLGRALAQEASVLLLDEPTSALDIGHGQHVLELVDLLRREDGITVLAAMHDLTLAGQYAERLLLLSAGELHAAGPPREVLVEELLARHYDASVRVVETESGPAVIPVR